MRVLIGTEPGDPHADNEDFAAAAPGTVVLLDGASAPDGLESGCVHSVAWYARNLGGFLLAALTETRVSMPDALAAGISHVNNLHADTCDLDHPGTPSATVVAARAIGGRLDYLALSDSTLVIERNDHDPMILTDDRLNPISEKLKNASGAAGDDRAGASAFLNQVRDLGAYRNQPGGFWVASTDPAAARQAHTGSLDLAEVSAVALLSDGATRLIDKFEMLTWADTLTLLREHGPHELIARTRRAETGDPRGTRWPRFKLSDDATALYWQLQD